MFVPHSKHKPLWSVTSVACSYTQNKHTQTSMPRVGFEPTTQALKPALERAATLCCHLHVCRLATVLSRRSCGGPTDQHWEVMEFPRPEQATYLGIWVRNVITNRVLFLSPYCYTAKHESQHSNKGNGRKVGESNNGIRTLHTASSYPRSITPSSISSHISIYNASSIQIAKIKTSWPVVRKGTIPTDRPPLVDEI
jgi:hypothetical protein